MFQAPVEISALEAHKNLQKWSKLTAKETFFTLLPTVKSSAKELCSRMCLLEHCVQLLATLQSLILEKLIVCRVDGMQVWALEFWKFSSFSSDFARCDATSGGLSPAIQIALICIGLVLLCVATFLYQRFRRQKIDGRKFSWNSKITCARNNSEKSNNGKCKCCIWHRSNIWNGKRRIRQSSSCESGRNKPAAAAEESPWKRLPPSWTGLNRALA